MSRLEAGSVVVVLVIMALGLPVLASGYSYADDFGSGGYQGSTGSESWTAPWTEVGESNGSGSGSVTVSDSDLCTLSPCLLVQGLVGVTNVGAARRIELNAGDSADLRYDIDFPGGVLVQGSALVQASADSGTWQTLSNHTPGTRDTFRVSLPKASSTIDIRFVTSGLSLLGSMSIDSVVVNVSTPATTTSTATTTISSTLTIPTTLTVPTTLTIPRVPTTTSTQSSTTTSTSPTTTRTSPTTATPPATTGGGSRSTTTPGEARGEASATSTTSTTVRDDSAGASTPAPPSKPPRPSPPSQTNGVVTRLDPGLGSSASGLALEAQEDLGVRFVRASEHLGFDIVASLLLGIVLAWASVARLDHRRTPA